MDSRRGCVGSDSTDAVTMLGILVRGVGVEVWRWGGEV